MAVFGLLAKQHKAVSGPSLVDLLMMDAIIRS